MKNIQWFSDISNKIEAFNIDQNIKESSILIIDKLNDKDIHLEFLSPSYDGGIIFEFYKNKIYYLIELFTDRDIVLIKRNENKRDVYDFDQESLLKFLESL